MKIVLSMIIVSIVIYGMQFLVSETPNVILSVFVGVLIVFLGEIFWETGIGIDILKGLNTLTVMLFDIVTITAIIFGLIYGYQYFFSEVQNTQTAIYVSVSIALVVSLLNFKKTEGYSHE